jgi:hypothetical protein
MNQNYMKIKQFQVIEPLKKSIYSDVFHKQPPKYLFCPNPTCFQLKKAQNFSWFFFASHYKKYFKKREIAFNCEPGNNSQTWMGKKSMNTSICIESNMKLLLILIFRFSIHLR